MYKTGRFRYEIINLIITFSPITINNVVTVPLKVVIYLMKCVTSAASAGRLQKTETKNKKENT